MEINGRQLAKEGLEDLRPRIGEKKVCFVSFMDTKESESFMKIKTRVAGELGIISEIIRSDASDTESAIKLISNLAKEGYDGIVVQLPMPGSFDAQAVLNSIPLAQDIDVLSDAAKDAYISGASERTAPVAWAVQHILNIYKIELNGKKILILGKGKLVGEPVSMLFDRLNIPYKQVDINTETSEREKEMKEADIIISGIGVPHSIGPSMIKEGAVLIDAGTSEDGGVLKGDIDPLCKEMALLYTPVPGGVGPLTVLGLFENLTKK